MALPASDSFDRSNSGTLNFASWTDYAAGWHIASNQAAEDSPNPPAVSYWNADSFANDQWSQCTLITLDTAADSGAGPAVRCNSSGDCIFVQTNTVDTRLYQRMGASTYTQLGSTITDGTKFAANDICYIQVVGTSVTVKKGGSGGSTIISASLVSGPSTGAAGIFGVKDTTVAVIDLWSGGNTGSAQSQAPRSMQTLRRR